MHRDAVQQYAVPAGPLAETLRAISRISGRPIHFSSRDVGDRRAPAIEGQYTAVAALQEAVAGSGLTMKSNADGSLAVFVFNLPTIVVRAKVDEAETGFMASRSDTATRSGNDLLDVPASITIITSKVMESQQALSVQDVLQNVSGVIEHVTAQGTPTYNINGFAQTAALSNGITNPYAASTNIAGVERIEVLKGPQAILSGGDSLGGGVNIVTKKPSADPIFDVTLQDGTYGDKTGTVDFSHALTDDKKLSFRVIGSATDASTSQGGFDGRNEKYLLPEIRWKDRSTDFILGASYDNSFGPQPLYTVALTGSIEPTPHMRLGNAGNGIKVKSTAEFYSLEHKFAPWLTLVSRLQNSLTTLDLNLYGPLFPADIASTTLGITPTNNVSGFHTLSGDHYLRMSFPTGPLHHDLSVGINHTDMKTNITNYEGPTYIVPVYANQQFDFPTFQRNASTLFALSNFKSKQEGLYAQDLITYNDWHALLSLRRTWYQSGPGDTNYVAFKFLGHTPRYSMDKTTPSAGLVYNITPNISAYASYTEGFLPQFVTTPNCAGGGNSFPPQETRNREVGLKFDTPDNRFSVTTSIYQLNQANRLQYNGAGRCYDVRAAERIRGANVDAQGQLLPGWNLIFNYTYTNATDTGDVKDLAAAQPRHQASLWTTYDIQSGVLRGWGAGAGITAYSSSLIGNSTGSAVLPGASKVDTSLYYKHEKWSFTLGVRNLFNRDLYGYSSSELFVPVLPKRTIMFTVRRSLL
jgi:iron complex outermembrane receptor protein